MDDIRRPQHLKRRDYAIPSGRPPAHRSLPHQPPAPHHPSPAHHQVAPTAQPTYHPPPPTPATHQTHPRPTVMATEQPRPHHPPAVQAKKFKPNRKLLTLSAAGLLAIAAIFGAGYLLRGSDNSKGIPASITRQVNYDLYFPSPMPGGYVYMKNTATFQIGQVYYKFASGKKRVTVVEQPIPDPKPNLNLMQGYEQFDTPIGKAAIGVNLGETQAVVVTPTTVITMNTIGGVTKDELRSAVSNLKDIGQRDQKT